MMQDNLDFYGTDYLPFLERNNVYDFKWLKSLLLAVEYEQRDDYPFILMGNYLHVEHILPQQWQENWSQNFDEVSVKKLVNSLGNLTLLSGSKNSKAHHGNFDDKKSAYRAGKMTSFEITRAVIDYPEWNQEAILKRRN